MARRRRRRKIVINRFAVEQYFPAKKIIGRFAVHYYFRKVVKIIIKTIITNSKNKKILILKMIHDYADGGLPELQKKLP